MTRLLLLSVLLSACGPRQVIPDEKLNAWPADDEDNKCALDCLGYTVYCFGAFGDLVMKIPDACSEPDGSPSDSLDLADFGIEVTP